MNGRLGIVWGALLLVGCGSSDPRTWDKCTDARCADPAASWEVYADGGNVGSGSWDFVGDPDPYICLTVAGTNKCSQNISDSSSPRWSRQLFANVTGAQLTTSSGLSVGYWDQDTGGSLDPNDAICSGTIHVTMDDLAYGGIQFDCNDVKGSHASATFRFHFLK